MKISVVSWAVNSLITSGEMTLSDFIRLCAAYNLQGVDLLDIHISGENRKRRHETLINIKNTLRETGIYAASYMVHNDFTEDEHHDKNVKIIEDAMEEAIFLGAGNLRVLGGSTVHLKGRTRENALKSVIKGLKRIIPLAENNKFTMVLENHGDLPGRSDELLKIFEEINSPYFKICFDMGNFLAGNMAVKENPYDALKKVISLVAHVHVKERRFAPGARGDVESCILGYGAVPLKDCLELLHHSAYEGYISCECEGEKNISTRTSLMHSIAALRTFIEKYCYGKKEGK